MLIGISFHDNRPELWNVGMPLALIGQGTFLIGLILKLDIIWQQGRDTSRRIQKLNRRLTDAVDRGSDSASPPHLDRDQSLGASHALDKTPERVLTDLKTQLDRLGSQIARQR
jgi:hypothetical protein